MPRLSGSVDSVIDEEAVDDFHSETPAMEIVRPVIQRQDSTASSRSRGKERHITSGNLEKMLVKIIQAEEDLSNPLPEIVSSFQPAVQSPPLDICRPRPPVEHSGSTTTESSVASSDGHSVESNQQPSPTEVLVSSSSSQTRPTIIVRGFSPSSNPSCRITSQTQRGPSPSAIPAPTAAPAAKLVQPKGRMARFALGASSGDDSYSDRGSLDIRAQQVPPKPKRSMFQLGGSSEENSLESPQQQEQQQQLQVPQQAQQLQQQQNMMHYANSSAIEDDDEDDDDAIYDESAIDDEDDSSEWEDSNEESGKSSIDSKLNFKRVDSSVNLTSRRSLITLMLANNDNQVQRNSRLASQSTSALPRAPSSTQRAHSSSPNDSDDAPLMMKRGLRAPALNPINEIPRSGARPIVATASANMYQSNMLSPKTTRRNMMATELTESLRRNLVCERKYKNQSRLNAALPRRYTSNDVANLKQHPETPFMNKNNINKAGDTYNDFADEYTGNSYHTHGW